MKNNLVKFAMLFTILATAIAFAGCEGYRCGKGQVLDKATSKPLDSVLCEAVTGTQTMYTDSTGQFHLCNMMSGCVPKCKDITIRLSKEGYKVVTLENPEDAVIYLER